VEHATFDQEVAERFRPVSFAGCAKPSQYRPVVRSGPIACFLVAKLSKCGYCHFWNYLGFQYPMNRYGHFCNYFGFQAVAPLFVSPRDPIPGQVEQTQPAQNQAARAGGCPGKLPGR
jgi:hypothetical protein